MPELTMGAATQIGNLEYNQFASWYLSRYGKEPPPNTAALYNDPAYIHWKTYIRPGAWSAKAETEFTAQQFAETPPEVNEAYKQWFLSTYGTEPEAIGYGAGSKPYQYWSAQVAQAPGAPPAGAAPESTETTPIVVIPGELLRMPEGSYADYNGMPVAADVAQRMLQEYQLGGADNGQQQIELQEMQKQLWEQEAATRSATAMSRLWSREAEELRGGKLSTQQKADEFERARAAILGSIGGEPRNWIQYWTAANAPNKWARQIEEGRDEISPQKRADKWVAELESAETMMKEAGKMLKVAEHDSTLSAPFGVQQYYETAKNKWFNAAEQLSKARNELVGYDPYDLSKGGKITGGAARGSESAVRRPWRTPETPQAPDYLAKYWPEATQTVSASEYKIPAGETALRIKQANIGAPSGQAWSRMLPSEQQGYLGYREWAGGYAPDVLAQMQSMLPQPRGGSRWKPYR